MALFLAETFESLNAGWGKNKTHSKKRLHLSPSKTTLPLSAGAFGFVVLAEEIGTNDKWAIKFLERGNKITKVERSDVFFFGCFLFSSHFASFFVFSRCALLFFRETQKQREACRWISGMENGEAERLETEKQRAIFFLFPFALVTILAALALVHPRTSTSTYFSFSLSFSLCSTSAASSSTTRDCSTRTSSSSARSS